MIVHSRQALTPLVYPSPPPPLSHPALTRSINILESCAATHLFEATVDSAVEAVGGYLQEGFKVGYRLRRNTRLLENIRPCSQVVVVDLEEEFSGVVMIHSIVIGCVLINNKVNIFHQYLMITRDAQLLIAQA